MNTSATRHDLDYDYPCNEARPVNSSGAGGQRAPTSTHLFIAPKPTSSHSSYRTNSPMAHSNSKPSQSSLLTVVPAPNAKLSPAIGCYYDVPKNIPVNPLFAGHTSSMGTPKFAAKESTANKPMLPQKSTTVLTKMSSYTSSPISNYSNASEISSANKFGTLTKPNTSKPLPPLPGDMNRSKAKTVDSTEMRPFAPAWTGQDDDDEDDCDYDYDYVCLESKKKLDDEDENVKKIISKDLQSRYERLVLNSSGLLDLQHLEKSLQSRTLPNPNMKVQFLQSYRHFLSISLNNFESWAKLDLEIIARSHSPSVYINFTKHILLSGQNLLLVAKSLNRHFGQIESLRSFADSFYDYLRQIVLKTKKSASVHPNSKFIEEMTESIKNALQFANNLNVDFNKHVHAL